MIDETTLRIMPKGLPHKFSVKLQLSEDGVEPIVFADLENDYADIICVFKGPSTPGVTAKFSKTDRTSEGYIQLKRLSSNEYQGVIDTETTKLLKPGYYYLGINFAVTDADIPDGDYNDGNEIPIIKIISSKTDYGLES